MNEKLCYVGKIIEISPIVGADFIESVTVVCGEGGKWKGTVLKGCRIGNLCTVYLHDSIVPKTEKLSFMEKHKWRVRMCRFKGVPSEVLIVPCNHILPVGTDITKEMDVERYFRPISASLSGYALGAFPSFIPQTDEPNWQRVPELISSLEGKPYFMTLKMNGSSSTAYKYNGHFGVCSRNLELKEDENNGYWKIANQYNLREKLPDGYALQWETCGPGINKNMEKLKDLSGFAFNVFDIKKRRYLNFYQYMDFCLNILEFPCVNIINSGEEFCKEIIESVNDGYKYMDRSKEIEGVVIRSKSTEDDRVSFKVLNLDYSH